MPPPRLIILKSPSPSVSADKYTEYAISHGGPPPIFVPPLISSLVPSARSTLHHTFTSLSTFLSLYSGLILTSQRAVEALSDALAAFEPPQSAPDAPGRATTVPLFVVGPATGSAAGASTFAYGFPAQILGAGSGTAAALASYILGHFAKGPPEKPLLYLVGETHDPGFAERLRAEAVRVEELVVYATRERVEFGAELHAALSTTSGANRRSWMEYGDNSKREEEPYRENLWIIVCAPSGLSAMMKALGWVDDTADDERGTGGTYDVQKRKISVRYRGAKIKVAAIGPKTEHFARTAFGFEVDAVAESPTPEGIWNAVVEASKKPRDDHVEK